MDFCEVLTVDDTLIGKSERRRREESLPNNTTSRNYLLIVILFLPSQTLMFHQKISTQWNCHRWTIQQMAPDFFFCNLLCLYSYFVILLWLCCCCCCCC